MGVIRKIYTQRGCNNYLKKYANNITSQAGEDGITEKIFSIMHPTTKWCVEFGAWNGREFSNTWNLIHNYNWKAILIEANLERFHELVGNNQKNKNVICLNKTIDFEGENSLDNILSLTDIPSDFDLLSIDIDGNDYYIWESLSNYLPKLVIIEFNLTIPNDIIFIQDRDMAVNQGCSLMALVDLASKKGYELIAVSEFNAFFVKREFFQLFDISDNKIDNMFDQAQYETKIFQLFDGTIVLEGLKTLLWHGIEIKDEDIQVLAKDERKYPDRIIENREVLVKKEIETFYKRIKKLLHV